MRAPCRRDVDAAAATTNKVRRVKREGEGRLHRAKVHGLDDLELELARDRGLDARAVELRVALRHVRVAHGQKRAGDLDGVVHRHPDADALIIKVAAARHRRDRVDDVVRRRREAHAPDVHVDLRSRRVHAVAASMA